MTSLKKENSQPRNIHISIDRGGTFTDVYASIDQQPSSQNTPSCCVIKLLSEDSKNYPDANVEGVRRVLEKLTGNSIPRGEPLDTSRIASIRLGTTVATNALLERNGEPCVLFITKGFNDLLHIAYQSRPDIFDLQVRCPEVLYTKVVEVDERVTLLGYSIVKCGKVDETTLDLTIDPTVVRGISGELVKILRSPQISQLEKSLQEVYNEGIRSIAICFLHSYTFPDHEQRVADVARSIGFTNISTSSSILSRIKAVPRGMTAVTDAYLTPKIKSYIDGFVCGFRSLNQVRVEFIRSDGGLSPMSSFRGISAILSGPAAGVVGYAMTSFSQLKRKPIIGFDMGGTSTDVSRYAGSFDHIFETSTSGVTITAPQLDISTVASGGSSRIFFRNKMFYVGPESAGSEPGPVCYRKKNGMLTITDCNLILGRISIEHFPRIFGPNEDSSLDINASTIALTALSKEIKTVLGTDLNHDEVAFGFVKVANETMSQKILAITQNKGFDVSNHVLTCFGGTAGQHAVEIARTLGIKQVFIHRHAPILSAYGLSLASVVCEESEPCQSELNIESFTILDATLEKLVGLCHAYLIDKDFTIDQIETVEYFNIRYQGTDTDMMICRPSRADNLSYKSVIDAVACAFEETYMREFGFKLDRPLICDDLRVRASAHARNTLTLTTGDDLEQEIDSLVRTPAPTPSRAQSIYFEHVGRIDALVYMIRELDGKQILLPGHVIVGPALILDQNTTVVLPPGSSALVTSFILVIDVFVDLKPVSGLLDCRSDPNVEIKCDPVQLSLFGHRFMHIAEEMGRTLQRTSISTNIKERLDFSCALFSPSGELVSNAPHIPVHLGSMQEAVKFQINNFKDELNEGTVIVCNHPSYGGSHLPDLTVITPCFLNENSIFYVASRGHHSDIGGTTPGSMPPNSKYLWEEGAMIKGFKIVDQGVFQEQGITNLLMEPAKYPGCSGTRNLRDNISDLKSQIAANQRGVSLCLELIKEHGLRTVHTYMKYIRSNAEGAVKQLLCSVSKQIGHVLHAVEYMDDGSPIELTVTIHEKGTAVFDFEGTGNEVFGNINAPSPVVHAAIIYCLRSMLEMDIPLNQGCLNPIDIRIPEGTLLRPSIGAAVVGGNVMTSQRVVDVILKAFQYCAASQGDCNNLTFGMPASNDVDGFGYYETIAGGSGAGPTWHGRSGVHTHMTNTRITDVEIMERRYPVLVRKFVLRKGSGGAGLYSGGAGVIRELEFSIPLQVSILSERRVHSPYGMLGGMPGQCGLNLLIKRDGRKINLGGKNTILVESGDSVQINTPGGGGFGKAWDDEGMAADPTSSPFPPAPMKLCPYKTKHKQ